MPFKPETSVSERSVPFLRSDVLATMGPPKPVVQFLKRESYRLVESVDLGTTARVLIVDKDGERYALKAAGEGALDAPALLTEHRVLQYLNSSPMAAYVPYVGPWLPDIGGFLMTHLRYPSAAEKEDAAWMRELARALRTLHSLALPAIPGLPDDRPDVSRTVSRRFRRLFELVLRTDGFWGGLADEDRSNLERVRTRYQTYVSALPQIRGCLANAPVALTHGDLAGDNLMLTQDGHLTIVDWGSARISASWVDVASLTTYSSWSTVDRHRFYQRYAGDPLGLGEAALRCLATLSRLHRYRSCVQSLLWVNEDSENLDAVGRAYFQNQLLAL